MTHCESAGRARPRPLAAGVERLDNQREAVGETSPGGCSGDDSERTLQRRVSAAGIAPNSGEVVTECQSISSRTDSLVRVLHAQPRSPVSKPPDEATTSAVLAPVATSVEQEAPLERGCWHIGYFAGAVSLIGVFSMVFSP